MGSSLLVETVVAFAVTAFLLIAYMFLSAGDAFSDDRNVKAQTCACPAATTMPARPHQLNERDQIAALERLQYALSEVGDGMTFVWRRWHGHLTATVRPTSSFKDRTGRVCRHIIVVLASDQRSKRVEGIACRLPDGRWQLDG